MSAMVRSFSCACGRVRCEAVGAPILSGVCYCLDCQEGGRRIEARPSAPRVRDDDGCTPYLTESDDRFRCVSGEELLQGFKLKPNSQTRRVVASAAIPACSSNSRPAGGSRPTDIASAPTRGQIEMHNKVERRMSDLPLPEDAPAYAKFPLALFWRLIKARVDCGVAITYGKFNSEMRFFPRHLSL